MKLRYFFKESEIIGPNGEWDGDEGFYFDYDVPYKDLKEALRWIVKNNCENEDLLRTAETDRWVDKIIDTIDDMGALDALAEYYEEDLRIYFEEDAMSDVED